MHVFKSFYIKSTSLICRMLIKSPPLPPKSLAQRWGSLSGLLCLLEQLDNIELWNIEYSFTYDLLWKNQLLFKDLLGCDIIKNQ